MSMTDAFTQASVGDVNTTIEETFVERVKDADGDDDEAWKYCRDQRESRHIP